MDEVAHMRRRLQGRRILRRDLDEIADHVVVLELQRFDAGLRRIIALQAGDHLAGIIAQGAVLVEILRIATAHEAAIARQQR